MGYGRQDDYHHLPRGLLARASFFRLQKHPKKAQHDLNETFRMARRSGMLLHETDAHLEQARLFLDLGKKGEAKEHLDKGRIIIEKTGYHRRDEAVKEIEGAF